MTSVKFIAAQHELICSKWKAFFLVDEYRCTLNVIPASLFHF